MRGVFEGLVLPLLLQSALVAGAVAAADLLVGRLLWPRVRLALWLAPFLRLLLPPGVSSPVALAPVVAPAPAPAGWMAPLWLAGVAFLGALALARGIRARRDLAARPAPANLDGAAAAAARRIGLRRVPRILLSPHARSACVLGLLRPAVVLPEGGAPGEAVLLHEMMHLKRQDTRSAALLLALEILFWPNLLLRLARRRLHALREVLCDAAVARIEPSYPSALRSAAGRLLESPATAFSGASILLRLRWLDAPVWAKPRRHGAAAFACALLLLLCLLPMGCGNAAPSGDPLAEAARAILARPAGEGCLRVRHALLYLNQGGNP